MNDRVQTELNRLLDEAAESHRPVRVRGKRINGILVSEEDWAAIQETLYLLSIPGVRESIRKGMSAPVGKLSLKLNW